MFEGWIDTDDLRIRFGVHQAREAVAGVATNAAALLRVLLIKHDTDRHVERAVSNPGEVINQLLNARLMAERRMQIGCTRRWVGRVAAAQAMHLVEMLRLGVIRFEVLVADWPGGGDAAVVLHLTEVLLAQTNEGRAIEFGVATDEVMRASVELIAVLI